MPRRNAPRCGRRIARADAIGFFTELNLLRGEAWGIADLRNRAEFAAPWAVWRDRITPRWIDAYPGSRPMAAYLLGEIPPPTWHHPAPACRHPLRHIPGIELRIADTAWHRRLPELEHLDALGLIGDHEWNAAVERLDLPDGDATAPSRYRSLADAVELQRVND